MINNKTLKKMALMTKKSEKENLKYIRVEKDKIIACDGIKIIEVFSENDIDKPVYYNNLHEISNNNLSMFKDNIRLDSFSGTSEGVADIENYPDIDSVKPTNTTDDYRIRLSIDHLQALLQIIKSLGSKGVELSIDPKEKYRGIVVSGDKSCIEHYALIMPMKLEEEE